MIDGTGTPVPSREMFDRLREGAEARGMHDPPAGLVADAAGGDPIPWDDQRPREAAEDAV